MTSERRAPVQGDPAPRGRWKNPPGTMSWEEHLEVYEVYAARFGRDQSAERIAERHGFSKDEAEMLIGRPLRTWEPRP